MTNRFFNPSLNNLSGKCVGRSPGGGGGSLRVAILRQSIFIINFFLTSPYDEKFQQLVISKIQLRIRIIPPTPTPRKPNELTKTLHRD